MKHEIDLSQYKIRTDLICEILEQEQLKDGYTKTVEQEEDITIETISINHDGAQAIKKKAGIYQTIFFHDITDEKNYQHLLEVFIKKFDQFLKKEQIGEKASCLVVGLGNRKATPDALGPFVSEEVTVTRHLFTLGLDVDSKYRCVSSIAPGVMGTTGIETKEGLEGIVEKVHPDFVIVIDALAASSMERINKTIQITNTGIHPGSGIGNSRKEISKDSLHVPVLAIGVPTVVDAVTIVSNTIHYMIEHFSYEKDNKEKHALKFVSVLQRNYQDQPDTLTLDEKKQMMGLLGTLSPQEMTGLIQEVLTPIGYNLMVTPKEIDFIIARLSKLIGTALNKTLHIR